MCTFDDDENFGIFWVPYFQTHLVKTSFSWLLPRPKKYLPLVVQLNAIPNRWDGNFTRFKVTRTCKRLLFCGLSKIDHDCDWNRSDSSDKIEVMHSTNLTRAFRQHWTVAWRCAAGKQRCFAVAASERWHQFRLKTRRQLIFLSPQNSLWMDIIGILLDIIYVYIITIHNNEHT